MLVLVAALLSSPPFALSSPPFALSEVEGPGRGLSEVEVRDAGVVIEKKPLRLRAVGDVMLGSAFPEGFLPPNDGKDQLAAVADLLKDADLTFANLEGPLCDSGESRKCGKKPKPGTCYAFRSPTKYAAYLKEAGIDVASTANNHAGDFGDECRRETEKALDAAGIKWSGAPGSIASLDAKGLRVAVVAFHTSPAVNDVNDHKTAAALVAKAAANHDLVIVSFHGGAEGSKALHVPQGAETFFGENRGDLRKFARVVIDAGADAVLGHGPHVARGMELYKDRLIAYSMGNFATYGQFNLAGAQGLGMILEVELAPDGRFIKGRIIATKQEGKGTPVPDPDSKVIKQVRELSAADFAETQPTITPTGDIRLPQRSIQLHPNSR